MRALIDTAKDDVVTGLLDAVRVRTTVYCRSEMRAPWGFGVEAHGNPSFHVVTRGNCWLEVDGDREPVGLTRGDLVLLPRGPRHWMRDDPGSSARWLEDILAETRTDREGRLRYGGKGRLAELVCGGFTLEGESLDPVLEALPQVVRVSGMNGAPAPWVSATLDLITMTASSASGAEAVLARLAETMVLQALRSALAELASADPAQVDALRDPQIAAAIRLIQAQPERAWTVTDLAAEVGYSRSSFAARFREVVGETPIAYLSRARLATAATLLNRTTMSIGEVARRSGYANAASFGKAFARAFGITPGEHRRKPKGAASASKPGPTGAAARTSA